MRVVSLISGGIDSAVSTGLALREKNIEVIALHLSNYPFAENIMEKKIEKILLMLSKKFNKKIPFIVVSHSDSLKGILKNCSRKHTCVLCRRMMFREAEKIAENEKASALVTGESLGQVASQTLSNLLTTGEAVRIPIIRPLLGLDKIEIERIARSFGTFKASIEGGNCCSIAPEKPATKSFAGFIREEEKKLKVNELINKAVKERRKKVVGQWS